MSPRRARLAAGERALVTGASAGLGEEFARQLAARGYDLVLAARRADRLQRLADELATRHGVRAEVVPADLARPGAAAGLWERATRDAPVHLLVNNAGFGAQGRFDEIPLERQREMVTLNCTALLELTHHAIGDMRRRGSGAIVNVASLAAFLPIPEIAAYAASKAFVLSLTEALAAENAESGVRLLALCPGRTPTEFQRIAGTGDAEGAFGTRSPEDVVADALRALERGRTCVTPGLENHLASWFVRLLPRSFVAGRLRRFVRQAARRA